MAQPYNKFLYYYPPRPENKITPLSLDNYDDGNFIAQPKLDGSACMEFLNTNESKIYDRHKKEKSWLIDSDGIHKGNGWMVLCGEWLNKNKANETMKKGFNLKFVIWDMIVYNGSYLTGSTFEERIGMLDDIYGTESFNSYLYQINDVFYRVKSFENNFKELFDSYSDIELVEGLVLKMKNAKLKKGIAISNNSLTMIKCRFPTKNYAF
jgi:hypothetical protein